MTAMDVRYWSFFGLGLLSLMLLMGALAVWWQARVLQRSQHRLPGWRPRPNASGNAATRGNRWLSASPRLAQLLARLPGIERYDRFLQQTGWPLSSAESVLGSGALAMGVLVLGALLGTPFLLTAMAALTAVGAAQATLVQTALAAVPPPPDATPAEPPAAAGAPAAVAGTRAVDLGERLDQLAFRYYGDAAYWRVLAWANAVEDPLRLPTGLLLRVPPSAAAGGAA